MSTELAIEKPKVGALAVMSGKYNVDPKKLLDTLRDTVFKGANESQLMALVIVANEYGLNPFVKEIYAFPAKGGGIVPVISIDGWLRRINEHPQFDGMEVSVESDETGKLESVTCTLHRKDRQHPTRITEYYDECKRNTEPWNSCPKRMLRHKAIIQAARVAFGFAGHDAEDAEVISHLPERNVTPRIRPNFDGPALPEPESGETLTEEEAEDKTSDEEFLEEQRKQYQAD